MDKQLAYLAGFLDGEGSIAIGLNKNPRGERRWYLRISCHQLDPRPLRLLADRFGGSVRRHGYQARRTRQIFEWAVNSRQAYRVLKEVRPYLIVKADEADVGIEFQEVLMSRTLSRRVSLSEDEQGIRHSLYEKLRMLKQRSYDET